MSAELLLLEYKVLYHYTVLRIEFYSDLFYIAIRQILVRHLLTDMSHHRLIKKRKVVLFYS